jgi:hypothetical protein
MPGIGELANIKAVIGNYLITLQEGVVQRFVVNNPKIVAEP